MRPLDAGLRQPDPRSCGAASVVMARLLRDDARTTAPAAEEFRREVLACHRRLTAVRPSGPGGPWQVPWPRALGTPPWAVRRELEAVTGRRHRVRVARLGGLGGSARATAYDLVARAGGVLYVGSRLLPRHVLLVLDGTDAALRCYQPSRGTVVVLPRDDVLGGRLTSAGWPYAWFVVTPDD